MTNSLTQVFLAYQMLDDRNGRQMIGIAKSKNVAKEIAKNKGWYGGDGEVEGPFIVCTTLEDYKLEVELQVRVTALAKLTPKEKAALGLTDEK